MAEGTEAKLEIDPTHSHTRTILLRLDEQKVNISDELRAEIHHTRDADWESCWPWFCVFTRPETQSGQRLATLNDKVFIALCEVKLPTILGLLRQMCEPHSTKQSDEPMSVVHVIIALKEHMALNTSAIVQALTPMLTLSSVNKDVSHLSFNMRFNHTICNRSFLETVIHRQQLMHKPNPLAPPGPSLGSSIHYRGPVGLLEVARVMTRPLVIPLEELGSWVYDATKHAPIHYCFVEFYSALRLKYNALVDIRDPESGKWKLCQVESNTGTSIVARPYMSQSNGTLGTRFVIPWKYLLWPHGKTTKLQSSIAHARSMSARSRARMAHITIDDNVDVRCNRIQTWRTGTVIDIDPYSCQVCVTYDFKGVTQKYWVCLDDPLEVAPYAMYAPSAHMMFDVIGVHSNRAPFFHIINMDNIASESKIKSLGPRLINEDIIFDQAIFEAAIHKDFLSIPTNQKYFCLCLDSPNDEVRCIQVYINQDGEKVISSTPRKVIMDSSHNRILTVLYRFVSLLLFQHYSQFCYTARKTSIIARSWRTYCNVPKNHHISTMRVLFSTLRACLRWGHWLARKYCSCSVKSTTLPLSVNLSSLLWNQ
ncbi:MAG: hypothetical protein GY941_04420 [Planctomycetes bacterium]|nr:hypothetical protein [Planctomycetota bacterium]